MSVPDALASAFEAILRARRHRPAKQALLVALSGIDGSGKGWVTARMVAALEGAGIRTAGLNIDGWLNLPPARFSNVAPAEHFYHHALRFEDLFSQLLRPLRDQRRVAVAVDHADESATEYRRRHYEFENIDVILVEGIFLLKRALRPEYDLTFWIECSFHTALRRAIARGQEGLAPRETVQAYETIYFPAQRIHFERDEPQAAASGIVLNDPLIGDPQIAGPAKLRIVDDVPFGASGHNGAAVSLHPATDAACPSTQANGSLPSRCTPGCP